MDTDLLAGLFCEEDKENHDVDVKMYLEGNVLRMEKHIMLDSKQEEGAEGKCESNIILFPLQNRPSKLKGVILDNSLTIPMHENVFWNVIHELERLHIVYEVKTVINHIVGHSIEFESLCILGQAFELVFHEQRLLHVYFGEAIANTSYFITTKDEKYNIGQIVRKELKGAKSIQVEGYGADDAWHYAYDSSNEYVYRLGYNV